MLARGGRVGRRCSASARREQSRGNQVSHAASIVGSSRESPRYFCALAVLDYRSRDDSLTKISMKRAALSICIIAACGGNDGDNKSNPDATVPAKDAPATPDADNSPLKVEIKFNPVVGSKAFACGQTYPHMGSEDTTITPRDFRFYASNIQLTDSTGAEVPLTLTQSDWQYQTVALLDFENFTGGCMDGTPETNQSIVGTVPRGTYRGLSFDIAIPETLNHQDLTSMPSPMNLTSLWWDWNFGHIFFAAVTHTDIATPTPGTNDHYFHVGATGCTGDASKGDMVVCSQVNHPHVELTSFEPDVDSVDADYGAALVGSALTTDPGCHSFGDTCTAPFASLGLDFATGNPTPTVQTVFRIH